MEATQRDDLSNGVGSVHGGVIATLVDTAANAAAIPLDGFAPGSRVATISMTVNYLVPARWASQSQCSMRPTSRARCGR